MNVQHVESLNDQIWQSTGVRVRETVPDPSASVISKPHSPGLRNDNWTPRVA
jgi:hypothetical protein